MDFKQLRSFVAVVDCGSFTKAAARLYTSQPTVSAHIRQLEDELHEYKMQKKITALAPRDGSVNPEQVMRKLLGAGGDL